MQYPFLGMIVKSVRVLLVLPILLLPLAADAADTHEAAARALIEALQQRELHQAQLDQLYPQMLAVAEDMGMPDTDRERYRKVSGRLVDLMRDEMSWEKLEPALAEAYANVYTEAELWELAAFFRSPLGQKYVERTPQLMAETNRIMRGTMLNFVKRMAELPAEMAAEELLRKRETGVEPDSTDWSVEGAPPPVEWPPGPH